MLDIGSFAAAEVENKLEMFFQIKFKFSPAAAADVFREEFLDELCDGGGVALLGGVGAGRDELSRSILSIRSMRSCILGVFEGVLTGAGEIEMSREVEICG